MLQDIKTIIWKEVKDIQQVANTFEFKLRTLILLLLFGIAFPVWKGEEILCSDSITIFWLGFIMLTNIQLSIGSFVGERESYSLETLLASRLPDNTIILGKLLSYAIFSFLYVSVFTLLNIITLFVISKTGIFEISYSTFPVKNLVFILLTCILGVLLSSAIGMFFSLKAKNWDQAQNNIRTGYILVIIPLTIVYNIIKSLNQYNPAGDESWFFVKLMTAFYIIATLFVFSRISKRFKRNTLIILK